MSSLWTPDGEHQVPPAGRGAPGSGEPGPATPEPGDAPGGGPGAPTGAAASGEALRAAAEAAGIDLDSLSDEERAQLAQQLEEMMQVRREVANTPAAEMLTNHMMRLFDLATIYLEADPPAFAEAATVIEGYRSMLDGIGDRLGEHEALLRDAMGQLQMLFVQVKERAGAPEGSTGA